MAEIKNFFPVKEKTAEVYRKAEYKDKKILNIGQGLVAFVLLVLFVIQVINFYSEKAASPTTQKEIESIQQTQVAAENSNIDNSTPKVLFVLGISEGKLTLFDAEKSNVYEVFEVYANTLPDYDKNLLENGIRITDVNELYSLLEDYGS